MRKKNGSIYDGDWRGGFKHGFGTLSVKKGEGLMKEYAGGWKHDMKHVSLFWVLPAGNKQYILVQLASNFICSMFYGYY